MSPRSTRAFVLKTYVTGAPTPAHFDLIEYDLAEPGEGQVLARTLYLGMDPFPRLCIGGDASRVRQIHIGGVMMGRGVAQVVRSRAPDFAEGDLVVGELGWREWCVVDGSTLAKVNRSLGPIRHALGILGPSGLAAWCATIALGGVAAGEQVLITAAAGAVGSISAQIAKLKGARVIGMASGSQLAFLSDELKLDLAVEHQGENAEAAVRAAAPDGINLGLDLVGGRLFDMTLAAAAIGARIVLVGTIADYNDGPDHADLGPRPNYAIIMKRAKVLGFLVADYAHRFDEARADLSQWLAAGDLIVRENVVEGFEQTPAAFAGLFGSSVVGKQLVRVAQEDGTGK